MERVEAIAMEQTAFKRAMEGAVPMQLRWYQIVLCNSFDCSNNCCFVMCCCLYLAHTASKSTADAEEMQRRQAWAEKVPPEPDGSMQASQVKVMMGDNKVTRRFGSGSFSTSGCSAIAFINTVSAILTQRSVLWSCVFRTCRRDLGSRGAMDQLAEFDCVRPVQCRRMGFMGLHIPSPENTRLHRRRRGKDALRTGL